MDAHQDPQVLKTIRKSVGLTQHQLAERAGVSRSLLNAIEQGRVRLRGETAAKLWTSITERQREQREAFDKEFGPLRGVADICASADAAEARGAVATIPRDLFRELVASEEGLKRENETLRASVSELRELVGTLRDLLNVETSAALLEERRQSLREKLTQK